MKKSNLNYTLSVEYYCVILALLIFLLPFVDLASLISGFRLSILSRGLLTLYLIYLLYVFKAYIYLSKVSIISTLIALLFFLFGVIVLEGNKIEYDMIELPVIIFKILMPVFFWFVICELSKHPRQNEKIEKALSLSLFIYVVSIPVSMLSGLDIFKTYGADSLRFGYKGIVSAGNEVSGVVYAAMGAASINYIKKPILSNYFYILSILFVSILLGTKGGFIGCVILIFGVFYARNSFLKFFAIFISFSLLTILLLIFFYFKFQEVEDFINVAISYYEYQYNNSANGSVINTILSGRLNKLESVLIWVGELNYFPVLIGGAYAFEIGVEMDFFDMLFFFGFLPTLLIIFFWCKVFLFSKKENTQISKYMLIFFGGWITLSFLAGHVLYSSAASIFFIYLYMISTSKRICKA